MATLDKETLNKQIVSMRKEIQRARVRLINKLAKEIKVLPKRKDYSENKEKYDHRKDRFVAEIQIMKNLKHDDVAKFALLNTEDVGKAFADVNRSLVEKVKVRFACYANIAECVNKFRSLFPNWEVEIPVLLSQLGCKYRKNTAQQVVMGGQRITNSANKQRLSSKSQKSEEKKEIIQSYKSEAQSESEEIVPKKETKPENAFDKTKKDRVRKITNISTEDENKCDISDLENISNSKINCDDLVDPFLGKKFVKACKTEKSRKMSENAVETNMTENQSEDVKPRTELVKNKTAEVRKFSDLLLGEENNKCDSGTEDDSNTKTSTVFADPFFITSDTEDSSPSFPNLRQVNTDETSMSNIIFSKKNTDDIDTRRYHPRKEPDHMGRRHMRDPKFQKQNIPMQRNNYSKTQTHHTRGFLGTSQSKKPLNRQQRRALERNSAMKTTDANEHLHPSWEARKRQREMQINANFQGKKIKFDDD